MQFARGIWERLPEPTKRVLRTGRDAIQSARLNAMSLPQQTGFSSDVMRELLARRSDDVASPVLDTLRFPRPGPARFPVTSAMDVISFVRQHQEEVDALGSVLNDDASRRWLSDLLAYRAFGPAKVTLEGTADFPKRAGQLVQMLERNSEHQFPPFDLGIYRAPSATRSVEVECWPVNVVYTFIERQYFFRRGNVQISPQPGDVVIDAGACFGDTALLFADTVGEGGQVHSFEPLPKQRQVLDRNLRRNPDLAQRISVHPFALDDTSGRTLHFADTGASGRAAVGGNVPVTTVSLDDFVEKNQLRSVDFIKMDIEGAETAALRGAVKTIARFRPRLAISIYHSLDDLISLPRMIKRLFPEYDLYVQHHTIHAEETILYGLAPRPF